MNFERIAAQLLVIFFAIGIHEYAHCKVADISGDPTPRYFGRVTLNLFKHFEPVGTIMILITTFTGFGIGWGRPAPCDPSKMKNPRWDHFATVAAGPLSNILQAGVWAILFRIVAAASPGLLSNQFVFWLLLLGVFTNIGLALFNLIPFGVLDGHWLLGLLMPEPQRIKWFQFNRTIGFQLFIFLIIGDQLLENSTGFSLFGTLLWKPTIAVGSFLLGVNPNQL